MDFFDYFLIGAILLVAVMISFTAVSVIKSKRAAAFRKQFSPGKTVPDWRVYAIDEEGNCFCGAEILLENEKDVFGIGRQEDNALRLMRPDIGRHHAKVTRKGIVYTYTDLGSAAGSICDRVPIKEKRLHHLMVVWVNHVALVFANCEVAQDFLARAVENSPR